MTRWEYLTVAWESHFEFRPAVGATPASNDVWYETWIRRCGHAREKLPEGSELHQVLSDLGKEGWELVAERIQSSQMGNVNGWMNCSRPVEMLWTLKRQLDAPSSKCA